MLPRCDREGVVIPLGRVRDLESHGIEEAWGNVRCQDDGRLILHGPRSNGESMISDDGRFI